MSSDGYTLGVDIGGTNIRLGLVSLGGEIKSLERYSSGEVSGDEAVLKLGALLEDYINRNGTPEAACIGFPATVDKGRETVLNAPNLQGFDGVPVGRELTERLGFPVFIEKDVNLLLMGDMSKLELTASDVVACYVGTGIGNAIMIGGQLVTGANGVAGELGHIPFGDCDKICGCGNVGCAEAFCGGGYLAELGTARFSGTEMRELFVRHGDDPLLSEYTERLGRVIAAEVNIIDPEILLLGGGVIEMREFPRERLAEVILSHTRRPLPHDNLKIVYSPVGNGTNGVLGAGLQAWRKIK